MTSGLVITELSLAELIEANCYISDYSMCDSGSRGLSPEQAVTSTKKDNIRANVSDAVPIQLKGSAYLLLINLIFMFDFIQ
jgi:hypothetical protein